MPVCFILVLGLLFNEGRLSVGITDIMSLEKLYVPVENVSLHDPTYNTSSQLTYFKRHHGMVVGRCQ